MQIPINAITLNDKHPGFVGLWTVYQNGNAVHHFQNRSDANILAREMDNGKSYEEALKIVTG